MTGCWWENYFRHIEKELGKGADIDLRHLVMPVCGGDGITLKSLHWINNILERCHSSVRFISGFGMSEVYGAVTMTRASITPNSAKKVVSVGIPYPCNVIGVFDEGGNERPYNTRGELRIKSPSIMKGYYKKEALTQSVLCNGWVRTGDLAEIDENGELYIWGRMNDCVMYGGKRIYLFDISVEMEQNPDVKQAMVLSLPDGAKPRLVAHLVLRDGCEKPSQTVLAELDAAMKAYLPKGLEIMGYKLHDVALSSSPTTAKKDRSRMLKCTEYVKPDGKGLQKVRVEAE